jgi:hypothetical protein
LKWNVFKLTLEDVIDHIIRLEKAATAGEWLQDFSPILLEIHLNFLSFRGWKDSSSFCFNDFQLEL